MSVAAGERSRWAEAELAGGVVVPHAELRGETHGAEQIPVLLGLLLGDVVGLGTVQKTLVISERRDEGVVVGSVGIEGFR